MASDTQLDARSFEGAVHERDLVERIVRSPLFAKSPRLSDFLKYVCTLAEQGRFAEINEQTIGAAVFGRDPDYDPTVDSIVRSHASRLRHRLHDYYETDGANEQLLLTIPKGSYIPRVEARPLPPTEDLTPASAPLAGTVAAVTPDEGDHEASSPSSTQRTQVLAPAAVSTHRRTIRVLRIALAAVGTIAITATGALLFGMRHQSAHKPRLIASALLNSDSGKTIVVGSDSALVILQHLTGRPVSLSAYTSHEYLRDLTAPSLPAEQVRKFATRRYMPVIDNSIYEEVVKLFAEDNRPVQFRYARDLRPEELKQGDAILLGSRESNPWVQLFEPNMNFYFQDDLGTGMATMLNRHPIAGEQPRYDMSDSDSDHTVYGLVAYRPNLTKSGHVLILEGLTMAGTQTASDFVLDDSNFLIFLNKIRRPDQSIPHFELLLRSTSVGGESSRVETVAYHVSND